MLQGTLYWHKQPKCVSCGKDIEEGATVYPITGSVNGLLESECVQMFAIVPMAGLTLKIMGD